MEVKLESSPVYTYVAENGRRFTTPELCTRYEYLHHRWKDVAREGIDTEEHLIRYYPVNNYDEVKEVQEYERLHYHTYARITNECMYTFPGWIYVSSTDYEGDRDIEPVSFLEECVEDVERTLTQIRADIAELRGTTYEGNLS